MNYFKDKMRNLMAGLDISTTTVGLSIILIEDFIIKEIESSYYKPNKELDDIKMIFDTKKFIMSKIEKAEKKYSLIPIICVEDILLTTAKTTPRTITILSAINRVLCVAAFEKYNNICLLPVQTVRATLRKEAGLEGRLEKENVPDALELVMAKHINNWKFNWELGKRGKKNIENYDRADSISIALAVAYKNKILLEIVKNEKKRSV